MNKKYYYINLKSETIFYPIYLYYKYLYKKYTIHIVFNKLLMIITFIIVRFIIIYYYSYNQDKNFSKDTDSITISIRLCNIPHISEHWP
jgi:hypothetical protein